MTRDSFSIQTRIDVRTIADLLNYFKQRPQLAQPSTNSELLRSCITAFRNAVVPENQQIKNSEQALLLLEAANFSTKQGGRGLTKKQVLEMHEDNETDEEVQSNITAVTKEILDALKND